ncbi:endonuclease V [Candidatus Woesearchaeota archaeon]|nr:endonuclease V [Candidatus Woesearchaeota archaeon]
MDTFELKKEQLKLATKVVLQDGFTKLKTLGGAQCIAVGDALLASVVICEFPSFKILENQTYLLHNPLPYKPGYLAYREMPALIEAYNQLEQEPDVLLVRGNGILHPRRLGMASHLGLALNKSTIGVTEKLLMGKVEQGKVTFNGEILGFEITTKEHANPVYASPGHLVTLGSVLNIVSKTIIFPHKMPEPLHLARKMAKKTQ